MKTYIDTTYNFSFQYPQNFAFGTGEKVENGFYIYEVPGPRADGEVLADFYVMNANNFRPNPDETAMVVTDLTQLAINYDRMNTGAHNNAFALSSFKTNSGESGIKVSETFTKPADQGSKLTVNLYYFMHNGYLFVFRDYSANADAQVSQIASTFKFTK